MLLYYDLIVCDCLIRCVVFCSSTKYLESTPHLITLNITCMAAGGSSCSPQGQVTHSDGAGQMRIYTPSVISALQKHLASSDPELGGPLENLVPTSSNLKLLQIHCALSLTRFTLFVFRMHLQAECPLIGSPGSCGALSWRRCWRTRAQSGSTRSPWLLYRIQAGTRSTGVRHRV